MAYATVDELAAKLNKPNPTVDEQQSMQMVLDAVAEAIDWEIPYTAEDPAPDPPPAGVHTVNIARAVELWKELWTGHGIVPLGPDVLPVVTGRDSWSRHRIELKPYKKKWGVA